MYVYLYLWRCLFELSIQYYNSAPPNERVNVIFVLL